MIVLFLMLCWVCLCRVVCLLMLGICVVGLGVLVGLLDMVGCFFLWWEIRWVGVLVCSWLKIF